MAHFDGLALEFGQRLLQGEVLVAAVFGRAAFAGGFLGFGFEALEGLFALFFKGGISGFFLFFAAGEVFLQVGFAHAQGCVGAAFGGVVDHEVGDDAARLDGDALGGVVAGGGDF